MSSQDRFFRFILFSFLFMLLGVWVAFFFDPSIKTNNVDKTPEVVLTELQDDNDLPEAVDNSVITELDELMEEIDQADESLDDLEL